jgi:hypothetical protein
MRAISYSIGILEQRMTQEAMDYWPLHSTQQFLTYFVKDPLAFTQTYNHIKVQQRETHEKTEKLKRHCCGKLIWRSYLISSLLEAINLPVGLIKPHAMKTYDIGSSSIHS